MTNVILPEHSNALRDASLLADVAEGLYVPKRIVLPTSWVGHIPFASWIVRTLQPRVVVELGVHTGNSFFTFAEAAAHFEVPAALYGIDTWAGDEHAGAYAEEVFVDVNAVAKSRFPDSVHLVRKLFDDACAEFVDGSVDLLHIDGLHTYEAVRHDFDTWRAKLSDRGVVLFHDIAVLDEGFGVAKFWGEIAQEYPNFAFRHSNGLGVLLVGHRVPDRLKAFAQPGPTRDAMHTLFMKLGDFLVNTIERGPNADALPINAHLDPPRVYLAADGAFDEARAVDAKPVAGLPGLLQCRLDPLARSDAAVLRIDPMNHLGIRAVHRVLLCATDAGNEPPVELVPAPTDRRERLTIVPIAAGVAFLGIDEDSQWYPHLDARARALLARGATLVFEPVAVPATALGRMLLQAAQTLAAPLEARLDELHRLEAASLLPSMAEASTRIDMMTAGLAEAESRLATVQGQLDLANAQLDGESARRSRFDAMAGARDALNRAMASFQSASASTDIRTEREVESIVGVLDHLALHEDETVARIGAAFREVFLANELAKGRAAVYRQRQAHFADRTRPTAAIGESRDLRLVPARGVALLDAAGIRWRATDGDPQFSLEELVRYAGHWVELTVGLITGEGAQGSPVIYFDRGEGMSESGKLVIPRPSLNSRSASIIFLVPPDLRHARFDPCATPSEFRLTQMHVRVISKWRAMRGMTGLMRHTGRLRRLKNLYMPQWRSMRSAEARQRFKHAFIDEYNETLAMRAPDYSGWIAMFEVNPATYPTLAADRGQWSRHPVISVIMPVYNTAAPFLREAIESVIAQNYPHWELCIADDASKAKHVRPILEFYARRDPRIKVVYRGANGHISAASNSALDLATGEFIALLDHDDRLHPLALHFLAETIVRQPSAKLIFSDEDKLDPNGVRQTPYFKCDFNPELFLAQNMVTHLGCYETALVRRIGGFRVGLEGSQDWDLALRVYEQVDLSQIVHIPRVLYHWRELPGSTAMSIDEKPYAQVSGRRAVEDHLQRMNIAATVTPVPGLPMWNRVRYTVPETPKVTIVIPTRDKVEVLRTCIESVLGATTYPNFEILIVDNGSVEAETLAYFATLPPERVRILRDDSPFNYSRINNRAVAESSSELVCLLNNDVEVINGDWLDEMVSFGIRDKVGIVGARLWYPDLRLQHGGVILGIGGVAGHSHRLTPKTDAGYFGRAVLHQQLSAVTGACLLIKRSLWEELGGLDETLGVAFNDIDLCLRATAAGYRTIWTPYAELIHYESLSRGAEDTPEKIARFGAETALIHARWGKALEDDRFYSPNLTLIAEDFSISWQPRVQ